MTEEEFDNLAGVLRASLPLRPHGAASRRDIDQYIGRLLQWRYMTQKVADFFQQQNRESFDRERFYGNTLFH